MPRLQMDAQPFHSHAPFDVSLDGRCFLFPLARNFLLVKGRSERCSISLFLDSFPLEYFAASSLHLNSDNPILVWSANIGSGFFSDSDRPFLWLRFSFPRTLSTFQKFPDPHRARRSYEPLFVFTFLGSVGSLPLKSTSLAESLASNFFFPP